MRILVVSAALPFTQTHHSSGIKTCTEHLLARILKGYEVDVFWASKNTKIDENALINNTAVRKVFKLESAPHATSYGTAAMKTAAGVMDWCLQHEYAYDKIIYHDYNGIGFYLSQLKRCGRFRHTEMIVCIHGNRCLSSYYGNTLLDRTELHTFAMERMSVHNADVVISPSEYYLQWYRRFIDMRRHNYVIPNYRAVINTDAYALDQSPKRLHLAFFGRICVLKGVLFLCDCLAALSQYTIHLCFIGTPVRYHTQCMSAVIQNRLREHSHITTEFRNNMDTQQAIHHIKRNKYIVVNPTLGETFSLVFSEMVANGIYTLASDIPGIQEQLRPEYHADLLFRTGNKDSFCTTLCKFVQAPKVGRLRVSNAAIQHKWHQVLRRRGSAPPVPALATALDPLRRDELVSVIMPTKNRLHTIGPALASIQQQTYSNIEIIVADDNSDMGSAYFSAIESLLARGTCRSRLVRNTDNVYKGRNCNIACQHARGTFLLFFDDDDIAEPDMIERYLEAYHHAPYDIMSCFARVFTKSPGEATGYCSMALGNCLEANLHNNLFGKGTFIIRKDCFDALGGYDEDTVKIPYVDFRFYIKAALRGADIQVYPQSLYHYRKNSVGSLFYTASPAARAAAAHKVQELVQQHSFPAHDLYFLSTCNTQYALPGNHHFKFEMRVPNQPQNTLVVYFHGARTSATPLPIFRTSENAQSDVLSFCDPLLYRYTSLQLGWFLPTKTVPTYAICRRIIDRIQQLYSYRHIIFTGSSGGAFPSVYFASVMKQACLLQNPQIFLHKYCYWKHFVRAVPADDFIPPIDLVQQLVQSPPTRIEYYQNTLDTHHYLEHCIPFQHALDPHDHVKQHLDVHLCALPGAPPHPTSSPAFDGATHHPRSAPHTLSTLLDALILRINRAS